MKSVFYWVCAIICLWVTAYTLHALGDNHWAEIPTLFTGLVSGMLLGTMGFWELGE